jgi:hypothetical protein
MKEKSTDAYVRFQTNVRCPLTNRPGAGIFVAAGSIQVSPKVPVANRALLQQMLRWFNRNLKVPRLQEQHWRSIFWFTDRSQEFITRLWTLVTLLEDEGISVRKVWTRQPGQIVYRDFHQIAAIPSRAKRRRAIVA